MILVQLDIKIKGSVSHYATKFAWEAQKTMNARTVFAMLSSLKE